MKQLLDKGLKQKNRPTAMEALTNNVLCMQVKTSFI